MEDNYIRVADGVVKEDDYIYLIYINKIQRKSYTQRHQILALLFDNYGKKWANLEYMTRSLSEKELILHGFKDEKRAEMTLKLMRWD
jgi:hypothetical protein